MFCKCIGTPAKCEVSINIVPAAASPRNVKLEVVPQNANAATTHLRGDHGDVHPRRTPPLFRCYEDVHLVHRNNTTVSCITALVQKKEYAHLVAYNTKVSLAAACTLYRRDFGESKREVSGRNKLRYEPR